MRTSASLGKRISEAPAREARRTFCALLASIAPKSITEVPRGKGSVVTPGAGDGAECPPCRPKGESQHCRCG
jgi:hypothetical protein